MRKLKKALSMLLAFLMIASIVPVAGIAAEIRASLPQNLQLGDVATVNINQGGEFADFYFTPEESGVYVFSSFNEGNEYQDTYGEIYGASDELLSSDDSSGSNGHFRVGSAMTAGVTYRLRARLYYDGDVGSFQVNLKEGREMVSIYFHDVEILEKQVADFLTYQYSVTFSDGTQETYNARSDGTFFQDDARSYNIEFLDNRTEENPWGLGEHNVTAVINGKQSYPFTVKVVETPIASVTFDPVELIVNSGGYYRCDQTYDEELGMWVDATPEYYYYSDIYPQNIVITMKDGTVVNGGGVEWNGQWHYINYKNERSQSYNNQLTAGNTYQMDCEILGYEFSYSLEIIESPVVSVTFDPLVFVQNNGGFLKRDQIYDEKTGEWSESPEYYFYGNDHLGFYPQNVIVTFKDGTTSEGSYPSWNGKTSPLTFKTNQSYENQWTVGNTYEAKGTVLGYEFTCPVEIIDTPIASVTTSPLVFIENYGGSLTQDQTYNQELGMWEFTSPEYYRYGNGPDGLSPQNMVVTFKDGSVAYGANIQWNGSYYNTSWENPQTYETRWLSGNTYQVEASILGYDFTYDVEITSSPIESITFDTLQLIEGTNGYSRRDSYWDKVTNQQVETPEYYYYNNNVPDNVVITLKDGSVINGTSFVWNGVDYWVSFAPEIPQSYDNQWTVGNSYRMVGSVLGYEFTYDVEIVESPVESITFDSLQIIENTNGYYTTGSIYDESTGNWYESPEYYYYHFSPQNLVITLKDGSVFNGSRIEWNGKEYYISYNINQSYENRWLVGNTYEIECSLLGYNFAYDVEIIDTPIAFITYENVVKIEHNGGGYSRDQYWDFEKQEYVFSPEYFRYHDYSPRNLVITMKDGRVFNGSEIEWNGRFYNVDTFAAQSYENQWTVGNTYEVRASILGFDFYYTVTIEETPIASITYDDLNYIEGISGYYTSDRIWDENLNMWVQGPQYYCYGVHLLNPVITMKDGTVIHGSNVMWDGNNYSYSLRYDQSYENQWTGGNTYQAFGSLLGYEFVINIAIEKSPVVSVEVDPMYLPENSGYPRFDEYYSPELGYWVTSPDYMYYDYYPENITITLSDGTKIYSSNFEWNGGWYYIQYNALQNYENQWSAGNTYEVTGSILGYQFTYPVSILEIYSNDSFEFIEMDGGVILTDVYHKGETLEIPSEVDGKPVIGVAGLTGDEIVKHLIVPDSVITIGDGVISAFKNLESISFGSGVKNLRAGMFSSSRNLKEIIVSEENAVFTVQNGELYDKEITTIIAFPVAKADVYNVPDTVTNVDALNYYIYSNLEIIFSETHPLYVTEDGVTYDKDKTTVISCFKNKEGKYVMPESVAYINDSAFEGCDKLTEVVVSSQVSEIVYRTFASCASLEKIDLPEGLISIGLQAFEDTPSLKSIDLPETLSYIDDSAFRRSGLTSLVIPDSVETIGYSAFSETAIRSLDLGNGVKAIISSAFKNTPVTSVVLPDSLSFLGSYAFENCKDLKSLSIGSGLVEIPYRSFADTGIENLVIPGTVEFINGSAFNGSAISTLTLNEGLQYISEFAFQNCNNLESVHIPASTEYIEPLAFSGCDQLKALTVEAGNVSYYSAGNCVIYKDNGLLYFGCAGSVIPGDGSVTDIDEYAFYDCDGLTEITIPDGVIYVGALAFADCNNLSKVVIGDTVEEIRASAFLDCPITSLELGDSLAYIPSFGFSGTLLSEITLPSSVTDIMYGAFAGCEQLECITIPLSVQSIEFVSFVGCESLKDVYYEGSEEDRENMFIDMEGNDPLLNATWHYNACIFNPDPSKKHVYTNSCDATCNIEGCEFVRDAGHTYSDGCDAECNKCGESRVVPEGPAFYLDYVSGQAGETVTVALRIKDNPGIVSMRVDIGYDSEVLELLAIEGGIFNQTSFGPLENNPISVNWFNTLEENNESNGVVATLTFKIKDEAPLGVSPITISYKEVDVYDFDMNNVHFEIANGQVAVVEYISGDLDGDGDVNNKDLGLLQRYINGWDVEINISAADVTGDGQINNKDLGILLRYVNGWDVELV